MKNLVCRRSQSL